MYTPLCTWRKGRASMTRICKDILKHDRYILLYRNSVWGENLQIEIALFVSMSLHEVLR